MLIKRRSVLKGFVSAATAPVFLNSLTAEAAGSGLIVVVVGLNGGNDGLNTIIPLKHYGQYVTLRTAPFDGPTMAYPEGQLALTAFDASPATAANHASQFAFAPSMIAMRQLYATGKLAVINGIGLPTAELAPQSHFNGWSDWSTGKINVSAGAMPAGWLGATLASGGGGGLGLTASMAGGQLITSSANSQGLVVGRPADFDLRTPYYVPQFNLGDAFRRVLGVKPSGPAAGGARDVITQSLNAVGAMQGFAEQASDYPAQSSYLGQQLLAVAQMIMGGAGIRGYAAVDGGYDTHSDQGNTHPQLLQDMSDAIAAFYGYLKQKGRSSNVVIVTISDFGRTPLTNLSNGTDHGAASVAFVLGDPVKGGVYGDYPSLTNFDANGYFAVNVDFRNMLSDIIQSMGGNPTTILGATYPKLGFI